VKPPRSAPSAALPVISLSGWSRSYLLNLTPLVPLSLSRRGGGEERGAGAPLGHPADVL